MDRAKFSRSFCQIAKIINDKNKNVHVYEFLKRDKDYDTNLNKVFFSTKSSSYLSHATAVCITIIKTLNSSSPCLKSIQIYGSISNKSSDLNKLKCTETKEIAVKKIKIPDEFLDELTHEMMRMPIRLPSKKVVDQSTLDKYLAEKKKNNEVEKDPFTCVQFSSSYKPIIDEVLKSKIDRFLFENQGCVLEFDKSEKEPVMKRTESKRKLDVETTTSGAKRSKKSSESNLLKCNSCQNVKNESKNFYELQNCKHVFCRFCLVAMKNKCRICHNEFKSNQLINIDRNYLN